MKKLLLLLSLAVLFPLCSVAVEKSFTLIPLTGSNSTAMKTTTKLSDIFTPDSDTDNLSSVAATEYVYNKSTHGLRFSNSDKPGNLYFNLAKELQITKVELSVAKYNNTDECSITAGGAPNTNGVINVFSAVSLNDLTFQNGVADITFESTTQDKVKLLGIRVATGKKRCYVTKITVYYNDTEEPTPDPVIPTEGTTYKKVTSDSDISLDTEYILFWEGVVSKENKTIAMGTWGKENKFMTAVLDVSKNDDGTITVSTSRNSLIQPITLVAGNTAGNYSIKVGDFYIGNSANKNNSLCQDSKISASTNLKLISMSSEGAVTMQFTNKASGENVNYFQVNTAATNERYANYQTGTEANFWLYKKVENSTPDPGTPKDYNPKWSNIALAPGQTYTLELGATHPETIIWVPMDETIATVADDGTVTALKEGTTTVTAAWSGEGWNDGEKEFTVTVAKKIYTPNWGNKTLNVGETYKPEFGTEHPETIIWESSDTNVASIAEDGTITALAEGTTTITSMWGEEAWVENTAEFTVSVTKPLLDVTMQWSVESVALNLGDEFAEPTLTVTPEEAALEVVLTSSNDKVARIEGGTVVVCGAGFATITASITDSQTYKNASASYSLAVTDPNLKTLKMTVDFTTAGAYGLSTEFAKSDLSYTFENGLKMEMIQKGNNSSFRQFNSTSSAYKGYDFIMQKSSQLRFTAPAGFDFLSMTFTESPASDAIVNLTPSSGTFSTTDYVWTPENVTCPSVLEFTDAGKSKMVTIEITMIECGHMTFALDTQIESEAGQVIVTPGAPEHSIAWRVRPYTAPQTIIRREIAATDWTKLNQGEVYTHNIISSEAYYLDTKSVAQNGHESKGKTILLNKGQVTSLNSITTAAPDAPVEYYTLQGIRVSNPTHGVFIRRQGFNVSKVTL